MIYKFTLPETKSFLFVVDSDNNLDSCNNPIYFNGREMGSVDIFREPNYTYICLTINAGYSWDGCTPKFKMGSSIIGIWDGLTDIDTRLPKAHDGSLTHDFLLQFKSQLPQNFTYRLIHILFYLRLLESKFHLSTLYYLAVCTWFGLKRFYKLIKGS